MVRITEDMVRKRAEHNECEIFSLEELSLHQQDLEKIEHLQNWCKHLKILYLQNNLINKIENVGKLKKLEYINLALNNVERIENLQGCESLKKLDLTVNFVGELTSIESLRKNIFFEELYLTGNPCTQFEHYKQFVYATLPSLKRLDGHDIDKSERIQAIQILENIRPIILEQQKAYFIKRQQEREEHESKNTENEGEDKENRELTIDEETQENAEFWQERVDFTPENRKAIQDRIRETNEKKNAPGKTGPQKMKINRRMFNDKGDPMNVNEAKIDFQLTENEDDTAFVLDVACYRYLDTSLIDLDVEPNYVRVTIKGKILQLALYEDVLADSSTAQRSQTTGHLIVTMPKLNPPPVPAKRPGAKANAQPKAAVEEETEKKIQPKPQLLEVNEDAIAQSFQDKLKFVSSENKKVHNKTQVAKEPENSPDFVDDPDVPPLM